ncbi:MAG: NADH-quinone oxidoreductase subunit L [Sediminibacterium sp. Gen4]|jgi:NADH-quinone oxidoreductase subunit L|uniref:NADH-quinone oxidoreductase subunit L n=1 Tax=unclassified Sediminibacterium TaxID=2635961 RepID=UPI0015C17840|nr:MULTISPECIES: NADH-quinone oxidoreductase subunit L [unclassified Sediminibacterium]MBW0162456.1 NADH-quinone oxidoreductase subunit L [Sediminibacterium sp.]MBW0163558.1 NADH-quinone oxidoreductase subunit L [Sediminibacterium sp.]NWK66652.1 NADH-quinone oxidoreductase subunit L [Sediminibacterium sp. Gen4]
MSKLVYLVPLFPLIGFLINGLGRKSLSKSMISIIGCGVMLASFVVSLLVFFDVKANGATTVELFSFIRAADFQIPFAFQVDQLSSLFLLIITGIGFLIHLYSAAYMHEEEEQHFGRYFAYLNLFVFSMLLLVLGANYVIMFIGWEGVGLCSYLLIGYWFKNDQYNYAAKKAFVMNRIGDLGFLLAVFWLLFKLGTVTYGDVFSRVSELSSFDITAITILLFVGAMGKSAQIPLYTWLPDAMAGPTPVSALIHAATMVTAGIYMIARSNILYTMSHVSQTLVAITGLATAIFAATIALKQNDIKKVLAYSTVSQLGYMFLGLGVGAYTGAVFHVMTHAFFKALLFLGAGSVIHAMHHEQDIRKMGGLKKHMPITHITFLLACLAIAGIPPFSGFFSKDEILMAAYSANPIYYYVGLGGALMTAFYMFRLYSLTFLGSFRGTHEQAHHLHESPSPMTIPLIVLAVLSVFGGFVGIPEVFASDAHSLEHFLAPIFAESNKLAHAHHLTHSQEYIMMGVSTALIIGVIVFAVTKFKKAADVNDEHTGIAKVLENKWYVDELYDTVIVKPLHLLSVFFKNILEKNIIDGVVNGVGKLVGYGSRQLRLLQSGQVGNYILVMVMVMVIFVLIWFNDLTIMNFLKKLF